MNLSVDNLMNAVENQAVDRLDFIRAERSERPRRPSPTPICWECLRLSPKEFDPFLDLFGKP